MSSVYFNWQPVRRGVSGKKSFHVSLAAGAWKAWLIKLIDKGNWAHISPGFTATVSARDSYKPVIQANRIITRFSDSCTAVVHIYICIFNVQNNLLHSYILLWRALYPQWIFCGWCVLGWASAPGTRLRSDTVFTGTARTQSKILLGYILLCLCIYLTFPHLYKSFCPLYDVTLVSILLWYLKYLHSTLTQAIQLKACM